MFVRPEVGKWIYFLEQIKINVEITGVENKIFDDYIFYLKNRNQYLFVCDMITNKELSKLIIFANKKKKPILIAYSDGNFQIIDKFLESGLFGLYTERESSLLECMECGGFWFTYNCGSWKCKCCGAYDGDHYIEQMIFGNDNTLWNEVF